MSGPGPMHPRCRFALAGGSACREEAATSAGDCILHADDRGKDRAAFERARDRRLEARDGIDLAGTFFPGHADFAGRTLVALDLRGASFPEGASFAGAAFEGTTDFAHAEVRGPFSVRGARFAGTAGFVGTRFHGRADVGEATFEGPADWSGAVFDDDTSFAGARLGQSCTFDGARFGARADFRGVRLEQGGGLVGVTFARAADFTGAVFTGKTQHVAGRALSQSVRFDATRFEGEASFESARFEQGARFVGTVFEGDARFAGSVFREHELLPLPVGDPPGYLRAAVSFHGARFARLADLTLGELSGLLDLESAVFEGELRLDAGPRRGERPARLNLRETRFARPELVHLRGIAEHAVLPPGARLPGRRSAGVIARLGDWIRGRG